MGRRNVLYAKYVLSVLMEVVATVQVLIEDYASKPCASVCVSNFK